VLQSFGGCYRAKIALTEVSIRKLKEIHTATHPAKSQRSP